jgi:Short C-terminal domain
MQALTLEAQQAVSNLAQRYGVSEDAVRTMLFAVAAGNGMMAQFYHAELGGGGQWMRGGMTMVGDMFNSSLKSRVDGLCNDLSSLLASQTVFAPQPAALNSYGYSAGPWWPATLGQPSSSGGQNDSQYAYFPGPHRLAVKQFGQLAVYDTLNHQIGGVQQQQGGSSGSFSFTSQFGTFSVDSLPFAPESPGHVQSSPAYAPGPVHAPPPAAPVEASGYAPSPPNQSSPRTIRTPEEILSAIEGLGDLHRRGLLSDAEFHSKKAELLAQL